MLDRVEMAAAQRRLARRPVTAAARPQPTLRSGADCLPQIEHIVILMMENHSYDNYFGMLTDRGDGFQLDESGLPTAVNKASNGEIVQMRRFEGTRQKGNTDPDLERHPHPVGRRNLRRFRAEH